MRRRTNEELPMPGGSNRTNFDDWCERLDLHQHNDRYGSRDWGRRMKHDAEWTVVGIRVNGMNMRHLDDSEKRKQCQTNQHKHDVGSRPRVAIAAHPCV